MSTTTISYARYEYFRGLQNKIDYIGKIALAGLVSVIFGLVLKRLFTHLTSCTFKASGELQSPNELIRRCSLAEKIWYYFSEVLIMGGIFGSLSLIIVNSWDDF